MRDARSSQIRRMAFSPDGKSLATAGPDALVRLWNMATGAELRTLRGHTGPITFLAFSADGKALASGSRDGTTKLWNLAQPSAPRVLPRQKDWVWDAAYSPDSTHLVTVNGIGETKLWASRTGRETRALPAGGAQLTRVAFSPDGQRLVTGTGFDARITLWNVATGRREHTWEGLPQTFRPWMGRSVGDLAFSPNGRFMVAGFGHPIWWSPFAFGFEAPVKIWEVGSRREVHTLKGHRHLVVAVAFSPDGKTLASASLDRTAKLWDRVSGREIRTLSGHTNAVYALAFAPDGTALATGSSDGTARIWEAASWQEIAAENNAEREAVTAQSTDAADPATLAWHRFQAEEHARSQRWAAALPHLDRLLQADRVAGKDRVARGHALARLGRWPEADAEFARAMQPTSDDPELWAARGHAYAETGRWDQAIADFERALQHGGDAALVWYRRALASVGSSDTEPFQRTRTRVLDRLVVQRPNDPDPWMERGRAHEERREWDRAANAFSRAIERSRDDPEPWTARARTYAERGRWAPAADDYARAIAAGSTDPWVWYFQTLTRWGAGDVARYRRACAAMQVRFGDAAGGDATFLVPLACALGPGAVVDLAPIVSMAEQSVKAQPQDVFRHHVLGLALSRAGRFEAALRSAKEALERGGNDGVHWLLMTTVQHRLGRRDEARQWLEKARAWGATEAAGVGWDYRLLFEVQRRETQALLAQSSTHNQ